MRVLISVSRERITEHFEHSLAGLGICRDYRYLGEYSKSYDALILGGGGDLGREDSKEDGLLRDVDLLRDQAEKALFFSFLKAKKPILGICRGHQVIAHWLGGCLLTDLPEKSLHQDEQGDLYHEVCAEPNSFLFRLYGSRFTVNSSHHQGVARTGRGMRGVAFSSDGVCEACEHSSLPLRSVQWHPERMAEGKRFFEDFFALAKNS